MGLIAQHSNLRFDLPALRRAAKAERRPSAPEPTQQPRIHALDRRLTDQDREVILAAYQTGESTRILAARFGIARPSIDRFALDAGLPRRVTRMTEAEQDEAVGLYRSGLSLNDVGARLGRSHTTILLLLRRRGEPLRCPHGHADPNCHRGR